MQWLYNFLEFITFYRVYICNHDDDSTLECHPNKYISYKTYLDYLRVMDKNYLKPNNSKKDLEF